MNELMSDDFTLLYERHVTLLEQHKRLAERVVQLETTVGTIVDVLLERTRRVDLLEDKLAVLIR